MIGTGTGAVPVMKEVRAEAKRRKIELLIVPTEQAIELLKSVVVDGEVTFYGAGKKRS